MAEFIYRCKSCTAPLGLNSRDLYPPNFYFEAGNKNTLSFYSIDESKFKHKREEKIMPFFETRNYWGIQRKRTQLLCKACDALVGYIYDDGPPVGNSPGVYFSGPSQVTPRHKRYRMKRKALQQDAA